METNKQQKKSFADTWQWFQVSQELDAVHSSETDRQLRDAQFLRCLRPSMCKKELFKTKDKCFDVISQDTLALSRKALRSASLFGSFSGDHKSKDSE